MKLLMITRKIDRKDALAGFSYDWIKKISRQVESLKIICLEKGDISDLAQNIEIHSLGKEKSYHSHFIRRLAFILRFQKLAWQITPQVDGVFCHMNPEYTILIWPWAKLFRKKIVSWYTHKAVTWKMQLMERLADVILTASIESFRLPSKKVKVVGHGIDTEKFKPSTINHQPSTIIFTILSVGRISPTKDYETLIKAADILRDQLGFKDFVVNIIGAPGLAEQQSYLESLQQMVRAMNLETKVKFLGPVPNKDIVPYYQKTSLFINLSDTGSLDKAVLEAMACGVLVLTSNEAFEKILPADLLVEKNNPRILAQKILDLSNWSKEKRNDISAKLRQIVVREHNLDNLTVKIIDQFN